ncbi:MAG: hypothetical protein RLZZ324_630 [Candidatus Parcubacteria bacterium]|jgi:hypothetical protein
MKLRQFIPVVSIVLALAVAFLTGFLSGKNQANSLATPIASEDQHQTRAKTGSAVLFGKISSISSKEATFTLTEWVNGSDNQEQVALELGKCSLEKIENDECLPNGFIMRDSQKMMTLPVAGNVKVHIVVHSDAEDVSIVDLVAKVKSGEIATGTPFTFTTIHGAISDVRQQYIP